MFFENNPSFHFSNAIWFLNYSGFRPSFNKKHIDQILIHEILDNSIQLRDSTKYFVQLEHLYDLKIYQQGRKKV